MQFKTKDNFFSINKQRICYLAHPEDHDKYQMIVDRILNYADCIVYWNTDMDEDDYEVSELSEFLALFIPVTKTMMEDENCLAHKSLVFAKKHHIFTIPIVMYEEIVSNPNYQNDYDKLMGKIQYLVIDSNDSTELSFRQKLERILDHVLQDDELRNEIIDELGGRIFLSYRKKDRDIINTLVRKIHEDDEYRDIGVWYDEYLLAGKDYEDEIYENVKQSNMIILSVTPSFLEHDKDGRDNYIVREGLAKATPIIKEYRIPFYPLEALPTDHEALRKKVPDLPELIQPQELKERLQEVFPNGGIKKTDDQNKHDYLIGMAYLHDIYMKGEHERGCVLLESAARNGNVKAMEQLVDMFWFGNEVLPDHDKAIEIQKKVCDICFQRADISGDGIARDMGAARIANKQFKKLSELYNWSENYQGDPKAYSSWFVVSQSVYNAEPNEENCMLLIDSKMIMARIMRISGEYKKALIFYIDCIEKVDQISSSEENELKFGILKLRAISEAGRILERLGCMSDAKDFFEHCELFGERLVSLMISESEYKYQDELLQVKFCVFLNHINYARGAQRNLWDSQVVLNLYKKAYEYGEGLEELYKKKQVYYKQILRYLARICYFCGKVCYETAIGENSLDDEYNMHMSLQFYQNGLATIEETNEETNIENNEIRALLLGGIGDIEQYEGKIEMAEKRYYEAYLKMENIPDNRITSSVNLLNSRISIYKRFAEFYYKIADLTNYWVLMQKIRRDTETLDKLLN